MLQLDFGCGEELKEGFIGIDIRKIDGVQHCCEAWKADQYFKAESVDEIYSRHLLQYLTYPQSYQTVKVWYSLLKPGAVCQVIVPDFQYYCKQYLSLDDSSNTPGDAQKLQECLIGMWGKQRTTFEEGLDAHKSGYDFKLLCGIFLKNGFKTVFRINDPSKPFELIIMAQKRGPEQERQASEDMRILQKNAKRH